MRRGCLTVADPIADALGLPPDVWVTGQGRRFGGPGPALPLSGALPRFAADGPVSRQRRRVGRDVATVAGSSRECGTGSDREGIDGTSPSGVETLARTLADAGVAVLDCEHRTPERAATGKPYIACQITPTRRSLGSPPDAAARASDPLEWQRHIRSKGHREALANRFRDPDDPLKVVIVRDMWLTGFNAPALHTMYVDKPMQGHTLMQAIARVNRKFRDKPGGLVVDYIGLADSLREAVETYTRSGGTGRTADDMARAEEALRMHFEVCESLFHGFDYSRWTTGTPGERLSLIPAAQEHILALDDRKARLLDAVAALSQAFALAATSDYAQEARNDVAFFQAVRVALTKTITDSGRAGEETNAAIRQIVAGAVAPEGVIDIFEAAGLPKPDISVLSDEFLAEVRNMPQKNLAVELLRKLLDGEIRARRGKNVVQARLFSEMLAEALRRYQNRSIETAQVIEELIGLAKEMKERASRGDALGLTEDELAFYDALETNDSAVAVLGDDTLREIARELVQKVKANTTIDWTMRENVRAQLRVIVRRTLRKYGYPPDMQEKATETVLEQAALLSSEWATA